MSRKDDREDDREYVRNYDFYRCRMWENPDSAISFKGGVWVRTGQYCRSLEFSLRTGTARSRYELVTIAFPEDEPDLTIAWLDQLQAALTQCRQAATECLKQKERLKAKERLKEKALRQSQRRSRKKLHKEGEAS